MFFSEFQLEIFSTIKCILDLIGDGKVTNFKAIASYPKLVSSTLAKIESKNIVGMAKQRK